MTFKILLFLLSLSTSVSAQSADTIFVNDSIGRIVQQQVEAYNARDIEAFLATYSDSVEVYEFPNTLQYIGKEEMRKIYGKMFKNTPDLHCKIVSRTVHGNMVIDQEFVTGFSKETAVEALAIYEIENGQIARVYFPPFIMTRITKKEHN